jgi:type II secretory pathway pseudopilin PulG
MNCEVRKHGLMIDETAMLPTPNIKLGAFHVSDERRDTRHECRKGLTMVEALIAVAIIAAMTAGFLVVSNRVRTQSQIQVTKSTLAMLDTALQQYYDEEKTYPPDVNYANPGSLGSPDIQMALGATVAPFVNPPTSGYVADYVDARSIEVLYYYLNRVSQSGQILGKLPDSSVLGKAVKFDANNKPLPTNASDPTVLIQFTDTSGKVTNVSLLRVVDAWGMPLQYIRVRQSPYNVENTNFPLIRSAGPDRIFGTADDIVNKKN